MANPTRRFWRPTPLVITLVVAMVGVVVAAGYVAWQYWISNLVAEGHQAEVLRQLDDGFPDPAIAIATPGTAWGVVRVPAWGDDWRMPVIAGDDLDTLSRGIGTVPGSGLPGEPGNLVLVAHRFGHGQPFHRLLELSAGDEIIVETRDAVYTYALDTSPAELTTTSDDGWVRDPKPGHPGQPADRPFITVITNQDRIPTADRAVAFGHLVSSTNK